jgi:hypothetical protein
MYGAPFSSLTKGKSQETLLVLYRPAEFGHSVSDQFF